MLITVLVPTHRGVTELYNIINCFSNQTYIDKQLVLIENGPGIGVCARTGIIPDAILISNHSKSDALNVGIEWLRDHGGGAWVGWDDDDYYGPNYLSEVAKELPGNDIIGKNSIYIRRNDGRLWLIERTGWPLGHSFAAWSDCVLFSPVNRWGEDDQWLRTMLKAGAKLSTTSANHFVWQRTGCLDDHIWPATDDQIAQLLTVRETTSCIQDFGLVKNCAFVDLLADKPPVQHILLPKFDPLNVPGIPSEFRSVFRSLQNEEQNLNI